MAINYVLNSKDSKMLIYEGFIHCKVNDQEDKTCWRCSEYKRIKCRGQVYLSGNKISKYVGHNNHVPNAAKVEAKKALAILRMTAKRTMLSAEDVLRYTASKVTADVFAEMPSPKALLRTVNRVRQKQNELIAEDAVQPVVDTVNVTWTAHDPINSNFFIPEQYRYTNGGELFLQYDSGPSRLSRLLLFATSRDLDFVAGCSHWFCDGTFSVCTPVFAQLYTVHGVHRSEARPAAYALLPDTEERTYRQMFDVLKSLTGRGGPLTVTVDHQPAAFRAVRSAFPDAHVRCSFFHTTQRMYRLVREVGLHRRYGDDHMFSTHVKMLPALAYVPELEVQTFYDEVLTTGYYEEYAPMLRPVVKQFEATWLGKTEDGTYTSPAIPLYAWNCFSRMAVDEVLFEWSVERWHNVFTSEVSEAYPSVWRLFDVIMKEERAQKNRLDRHTDADNATPRVKKAYRSQAMKILSLYANYKKDVSNVHNYLLRIAYNFQLQA